jgi:hypothetical protein
MNAACLILTISLTKSGFYNYYADLSEKANRGKFSYLYPSLRRKIIHWPRCYVSANQHNLSVYLGQCFSTFQVFMRVIWVPRSFFLVILGSATIKRLKNTDLGYWSISRGAWGEHLGSNMFEWCLNTKNPDLIYSIGQLSKTKYMLANFEKDIWST